MHPMMRFLCGTVTFEALGGYPERFLNEAAVREIAVWDTARRGAALYGECRAAEYRELRPVAKKSGVRLRLKKRRGLPFLLRPFRLRWGIAAGAVAAVVVLQLLSSRVWVITVQGNQTLPDEEILQVIAPLGVTVGADFKRVDIAAVQLTALEQLPKLGWLTVNQSGSTVEVLVREKDDSVKTEDNTPANIVADADGIVRSVTVTGGQAMVKAGDAVRKGDLVISGVTDSTVGPLLRRAKGTVIAQTSVELTIEVPFAETVRVSKTVAARPTFLFFGLRLPLYTANAPTGDYTTQTTRHLLTANGRELPVGWVVTRLMGEEETVVTRNADEALTEAYRRLEKQEGEWTEWTIENKAVTERESADGIVLTASYTVVREIGITRPIETE